MESSEEVVNIQFTEKALKFIKTKRFTQTGHLTSSDKVGQASRLSIGSLKV